MFKVVNVRDDDTVVTMMEFQTFDEAAEYREMLQKGDENDSLNGEPVKNMRYFVLDF